MLHVMHFMFENFMLAASSYSCLSVSICLYICIFVGDFVAANFFYCIALHGMRSLIGLSLIGGTVQSGS